MMPEPSHSVVGASRVCARVLPRRRHGQKFTLKSRMMRKKGSDQISADVKRFCVSTQNTSQSAKMVLNASAVPLKRPVSVKTNKMLQSAGLDMTHTHKRSCGPLHFLRLSLFNPGRTGQTLALSVQRHHTQCHVEAPPLFLAPRGLERSKTAWSSCKRAGSGRQGRDAGETRQREAG